MFHGARTADAHSAATIIRDRVLGEGQTLAAVGYSLGAIVLNHYVASYGDRVALDASVSISGALDCSYQQYYARSQRIWQSMIVAHMKDKFLFSKWGDRIIKRVGPKNFQGLMRAQDIVVSLMNIAMPFVISLGVPTHNLTRNTDPLIFHFSTKGGRHIYRSHV